MTCPPRKRPARTQTEASCSPRSLQLVYIHFNGSTKFLRQFIWSVNQWCDNVIVGTSAQNVFAWNKIVTVQVTNSNFVSRALCSTHSVRYFPFAQNSWVPVCSTACYSICFFRTSKLWMPSADWSICFMVSLIPFIYFPLFNNVATLLVLASADVDN